MSTFKEKTDATNAFNGLDGGADSGATPDDMQGHGALAVPLAVPLAGSDEPLSSHHDDHGADTAPVQGQQSDAGSAWATMPAVGTSTTALRSVDGESDLGLVFGHSDGGLKRLLSASPTTALVVAPQGVAANPIDGFSAIFSSAAISGSFDSATSTDTAAGGLDGVASYRLSATAAAAPAFVGLTGTSNPFDGLRVVALGAPSLGDIDGDGDLDLVVGEREGVLTYYRNTGTATAPVYAVQAGTNSPFNGIDVRDNSTPSLGDIDGDGDLDLMVGERDGVLNYYRNTGTATAPVYAEQTGTNNPLDGVNVGAYSSPSLGDIDGDGDLDLVVGKSSGTMNYYRNTGNANAPAYAEQIGTNNPFNAIDVGSFNSPSLVDFDSDGDLDLVVGEDLGALKYSRNTGSATAPAYAGQTGTNNPFNGIDVGNASTPSLGDIDGDGDLDLVVGNDDGRLLTFQNQDTATTPVYAGTPPTGNPFNGIDVGTSSAPSLGDIDGDGDLDLVVGESDGTLNYYRNTGTGTAPVYSAQAGANNPFNGFAVGLISSTSLGDIDGDGDLDLVVGDAFGTLNYYRNTGTATAPVYSAQTGTNNPFNGFDVGVASTPSLGDIDGDGDLDLVVGKSDGFLNYYQNTGTATAPVYAVQNGTNNPFNGFDVGLRSTPSLGDIDGDGDLDLVVGENDGVLNYYLNTGTATTPVYAVQTGTGNPFGAFDVGFDSTPSLSDIDGDGDLDLVLGNSDGLVLTAFNNDAPTLGQAAFNLTATNEDTDSTPVTVASLLASAGWADSDARALQGLAVTSTSGAGWQYSVGGSTWTPVGAASATAAVLLGAGTQLRYAPDRANSETATLTFRAWDQSSGTASTDGTARTADTSSNGGGTAFSTASSTASLEVTAVNDAPTLSVSAFNLPGTDEDTTAVISVADLLAGGSWADVDTNPLKGVVVTAATGSGQWQWASNGTFWVNLNTALFAPAFDINTSLRYLPNGTNGEIAALSFRAWDQTEGSPSSASSVAIPPAGFITVISYGSLPQTDVGGTTSQSSTISTASLAVSSVNDAPTLSQSAITLTGTDEDTASAGTTVLAMLTAAGQADVDTGALKGLAVTASTGAGTWQYNTGGVVWTTFSAVSNASALLLGAGTSVRYVPDAKNGETATLSFRAWDQSSGAASTDGTARTADTTTNGGTTAFSTASSTASLAVISVNDAPTTTPVALALIQEDSATLLITQTMLLVNANDVDLPAQLLTASNLQKTGGLGQLVNNNNGTWSYTPAANDDTNVSFSYSVSDGKLSAAGSATLDITPVNDNPVAVADTALTKLNTAVSIAVLANDSDIDGGALRVVATTQGNGGTAAVQPGNLTVLYTPSTGFSGFDSFNYTVSDGVGGSATGNVRVLVASALGTNGNDALLGTQLVDYIVGQDGDDSIQARGGADYVDGGRGADTISGGDGADTLLGGDGPDTFVATGPELVGDQIDGGDGTDTLVVTSSMAVLPANFSFTNLEQVSHNGLVVLHPGLVDLSALTLAPGSNNKIIGDVANNRIIGTKSDDNISDTAGNDDLRGADGSDTIQAGVGQDTIYGGNGNDRLCGDRFTSPNDGARDTFVFDTALNAATNVDQIVGFQASSQDLIMLAPSIFGAITGGATTGLDADEFRSVNGGNAQDGNDFILFDPLTGNLFYDADGSGGGTKVLFATLVSLAGTLDATDFVAAVP